MRFSLWILSSLAVAGLTLGACATPVAPPVAPPAGPHAQVFDSVVANGSAGGTFYSLVSIDGSTLEDDSVSQSRRASFGNGGRMNVRTAVHYVPAGKVRLGLQASTSFASLFDNLTRNGAGRAVAGTIEVELQDKVRYYVRGTLDAFRREVWLSDEAGNPVGPRIADRSNLARAQADPNALYTCCNLHYDGDWISDANWARLPMIPAGSRILVKDFGWNRVAVEIDGQPMRLGVDYARKQISTEKFVGLIAVKEDPQQKLGQWPAATQAAIRAGKARVGMTREQVLMALGYPRLDHTPSLDSDRWTYLSQDDEPIVFVWGTGGTLTAVEAAEPLRALLLDGGEPMAATSAAEVR